MTPERLQLLFRIDVVANAGLALAAVALLAAPDLLGVPRPALAVAAVVLLVNAVALARTAASAEPAVSEVVRSGAIDLVAAVVLLTVALLGLPGQGDAARWVLAGLGDVCLVVGGLKLLGARRVARHVVRA